MQALYYKTNHWISIPYTGINMQDHDELLSQVVQMKCEKKLCIWYNISLKNCVQCSKNIFSRFSYILETLKQYYISLHGLHSLQIPFLIRICSSGILEGIHRINMILYLIPLVKIKHGKTPKNSFVKEVLVQFNFCNTLNFASMFNYLNTHIYKSVFSCLPTQIF